MKIVLDNRANGPNKEVTATGQCPTGYGRMKMKTVSKSEYETFLANIATLSETEIEQGGEFAYENSLDMDGETVAFATYRGGEIISYHVAG